MALTIRPDAALREQLDAIARAQAQSVNQYLLSLVRNDVARRQRLASAVGLSWRSSDAELADALAAAVSTPLSDIEQAHLPADPTAAVSYAVARAAHKRRNARAGKPATSPGSKPAPSSSTKPAPSRGTAAPKQRAGAVPAPAKAQTRSAARAPKTLTSAHADQLRALAPQLGVSTQQLISHAMDRIGPYGKYMKGVDVRVAIAVDEVLGLGGGR